MNPTATTKPPATARRALFPSAAISGFRAFRRVPTSRGTPGPTTALSLLLTFFALASVVSAAADPGIKYHPGHYIAFNGPVDFAQVNAVKDDAVAGVSKRYSWSSLEPEKDRYDFSAIEKDLAYLAGFKKQLVVFITDKTFSPDSSNPIPVYARAHGVINEKGGVSAKKWDRFIIERQVALCKALAKVFDDNPFFEGIAYQESAPSVSESGLRQGGYTPELMRDGLIQLLTESSKAFPRSQVFWYQNFLPQNNDYLYEVAAACVPYRVVMGGPDILPYRDALIRTYPIYARFKDKLKLFCAAQNDSYRHHKDDRRNGDKRVFHQGKKPIHPDGYVTLEEIFRFGRDQLFLNYIFYSYEISRSKSYPGDPQQFVFEDAFKVMRAHPEFNRR